VISPVDAIEQYERVGILGQRSPGYSYTISALIGCVVLGVYVYTAFPSLSGGDSGELINTTCQLSVAHPPGYPTYTLLGWLAHKIIPAEDPARRLNLLCCLQGALAAFFLHLAATRLSVTRSPFIAAIAALGFAFSPTVWLYSIQGEVFALNNMLCAAMVFLTVKFYHHEQVLGEAGARDALLPAATAAADAADAADADSSHGKGGQQQRLQSVHDMMTRPARLSAAASASGPDASHIGASSVTVVAGSRSGGVGRTGSRAGAALPSHRRLYSSSLSAARSLAMTAVLGALVCGLAMSNQHTTVFYVFCTVLAVTYALWARGVLTVALAAQLSAALALGMAPYVYLPLAALRKPFDSWGDQRTLAGFLIHFLRQEYGTFRLASGDHEDPGMLARLAVYARVTSQESLHLGPPLALLGLLFTLAVRTQPQHQAARRATVVGLVSYLLYVAVFHWLANLEVSPLLIGVQARFWMQANLYIFVWAALGFEAIALAAVSLLSPDCTGASRVAGALAMAPVRASATLPAAARLLLRLPLGPNLGPALAARLSLLVAADPGSEFYPTLLSLQARGLVSLTGLDAGAALTVAGGHAGPAQMQQEAQARGITLPGASADTLRKRGNGDSSNGGSSSSGGSSACSAKSSSSGSSVQALLSTHGGAIFSLRRLKSLLVSAAVLFAAAQCHASWRRTDQHATTVLNTVGAIVLDSFPPQAIVLLNGDLNNNMLKYRQTCLGERPDLDLVSVQLMTWDWFVEMQGHHYPRTRFPGHRYHPFLPGAFSMAEFLAANAQREVFLCGSWKSGDHSHVAAYTAIAYGQCQQVFPNTAVPQGKALAKFLQKSLLSVPKLSEMGPFDAHKYTDETWEFIAYQDAMTRLAHLTAITSFHANKDMAEPALLLLARAAVNELFQSPQLELMLRFRAIGADDFRAGGIVQGQYSERLRMQYLSKNPGATAVDARTEREMRTAERRMFYLWDVAVQLGLREVEPFVVRMFNPYAGRPLPKEVAAEIAAVSALPPHPVEVVDAAGAKTVRPLPLNPFDLDYEAAAEAVVSSSTSSGSGTGSGVKGKGRGNA
jgi:hypothetical protein